METALFYSVSWCGCKMRMVLYVVRVVEHWLSHVFSSSVCRWPSAFRFTQ